MKTTDLVTNITGCNSSTDYNITLKTKTAKTCFSSKISVSVVNKLFIFGSNETIASGYVKINAIKRIVINHALDQIYIEAK